MLLRSVFCFGITGFSLKPSPTIQMVTWQPWHSPKDWHEMTLKFMPSNSDQWGDDIVAKRSSKDRGYMLLCKEFVETHPSCCGTPVPRSPKSTFPSFSAMELGSFGVRSRPLGVQSLCRPYETWQTWTVMSSWNRSTGSPWRCLKDHGRIWRMRGKIQLDTWSLVLYCTNIVLTLY